MCLGIPGQVEAIIGNAGTVKIGDAQIKVGLDLVPEVAVDDYVLIHARFAVQIIDQHEAMVTWGLIKELAGDEGCETSS